MKNNFVWVFFNGTDEEYSEALNPPCAPCGWCEGSGEWFNDICPNCEGTGQGKEGF